MLSPVPKKRLGGNYAALKASTSFDNFDWDGLYNKELVPQYVPPGGNYLNRNNLIPQLDELAIDFMKKESLELI